MLRLAGAALALALSAGPKAPPGPRCEGHPKLVGPCYEVRGLIQTWDGNPTLRIWPFGTKRLLGVVDPEPGREYARLPPDLEKAISGFDHRVDGDFRVCPLTPEREGWMRMVCVESASNLKVRPY